jgi:hypothetical protein
VQIVLFVGVTAELYLNDRDQLNDILLNACLLTGLSE